MPDLIAKREPFVAALERSLAGGDIEHVMCNLPRLGEVIRELGERIDALGALRERAGRIVRDYQGPPGQLLHRDGRSSGR